jgi:hypothetical protein
VYQQAGERNFHIFYQLTKGATQQERRKFIKTRSIEALLTEPILAEQFKLMGPEKYLYTSMGQSLNVQGIDDVADFKEVRVSAQNNLKNVPNPPENFTWNSRSIVLIIPKIIASHECHGYHCWRASRHSRIVGWYFVAR